MSYEYSDNLLALKNIDGLWGVLDINGNIVLGFAYEELGQANEGLIPFMKYGTWGYIDYTGNIVIERQFESAYKFQDGLAIVKKDGKYGFINTKGEIVVSNDYFNLEQFNEYGFAYAVAGDRFSSSTQKAYLIDKQGNTLLDISAYGRYLGGKFIKGEKLYRIANDD